MHSHWLFRQLKQTKRRIAFNLLIAPIGGMLSVYLPVCLLFMLVNLVVSDIALGMLGLVLLILSVASLGYVLYVYVPVLICLYVLRYFKLFNIINILILGLIAALLFAYVIDATKFWSTLITLSFFSVPTIGFFIFLTLRRQSQSSETA